MVQLQQWPNDACLSCTFKFKFSDGNGWFVCWIRFTELLAEEFFFLPRCQVIHCTHAEVKPVHKLSLLGLIPSIPDPLHLFKVAINVA